MTSATNQHLPIILVRGYGGFDVSDERRNAYQGFNDGSVYPRKRGENYIYEGMVLKFMKSEYTYQDATNVVGYYASSNPTERQIPAEITDRGISLDFFTGTIAIDPGTALTLLRRPPEEISRTLWIYRYYDLERNFGNFCDGLVRLIAFIRALGGVPGEPSPMVNIIAHSMGGLIVREALQVTYPQMEGRARAAEDFVNKVVTLGTPHQGITFQLLRDWIGLDAETELERFNQENQADHTRPGSYKLLDQHFDPRRILTVVGTNYRTYSTRRDSALNRLFSVAGEFGPLYNRSDGLVKQASAQLPGAPRTFVNKCHSGEDSLVTSREAYEIACRFFFGDTRVRLQLVGPRIKHGADPVGGSEFFLGVSVKARDVDFELFHQSRGAENCYGPFRSASLDDPLENVAFPPLPDWTIWEGWIDSARITRTTGDLVLRLELYVSERDSFGVRFSDDVILHRQLFIRMAPGAGSTIKDGVSEVSFSEESGLCTDPTVGRSASPAGHHPSAWDIAVDYADFEATLRIETLIDK